MKSQSFTVTALIISASLLAVTPTASALQLAGITDAVWTLDVGNNDIPQLPADFFHPGSEPFIGQVSLQPCIADFTGGCLPQQIDPIDLFAPNPTLPQPDIISVELVELSLRSAQPILVGSDATATQWDVHVTLTPQPPAPGDPADLLPPGPFIVDSFFDIEYFIDFVNPGTGQPADGGPIVGILHLQNQPMPWFHDPLNGLLIPGFDGFVLNPFDFVSPDGGLSIGGVSQPPTPPTIPGDLNGDGFVGIEDLNIVLSAWNQSIPPGDPDADPSGDGFVGIEDLNIVLGNWNNGSVPQAPSNIPEPASLAFAGVCGLILLRQGGLTANR